MTSSTLQEVRTVEPLDFHNPAHRGIIFDLALQNEANLYNDHDFPPERSYAENCLLMISSYEYRQSIGELHAFIAMIEGKPAGCFWIEIAYGIGRVRGALFPEFKNTWNALHFMRWLVEYGFDVLNLRKLDSEMVMYQKDNREAAAAERVLKRIGFTFRVALPEAIVIHGQAHKTILLDYLKRVYDVKKQ